MNLDYIVLRWASIDSIITTDEDVDILISSESAPQLMDILTNNKGVIPLDIYSDDGSMGLDFKGAPYFPKKISKILLKKKILYNDIFFAPDNYGKLISFVYHITYQKANPKILKDQSTNKYRSELLKLLSINKVNIKIDNLLHLHNYLANLNFSPSYDLLKLYSKKKPKNTFFKELINKYNLKIDGEFI